MSDEEKRPMQDRAEQAAALMKKLCRGVVHNSVCIQTGSIFLLGLGGTLHAIQPGWEPTFTGTQVFFPSN